MKIVNFAVMAVALFATNSMVSVYAVNQQLNSATKLFSVKLGATRVIYHGSHSGFRVWSDEQKAGNTPTVLLLSGQQDPRHHIQVRLEGEGWQPDTVSGRGAILRTAADNASFSVVVDGNQEVPADTWTLDFKACALAQEDT
ncbi:hypothetical protein BUX93_004721 [Salmonella enterica subsp. enterica serovar Typhimurium]|nr:hypothetical protein [Salmonella enterica subsp. enterica serovar Typhimurium]